MSRSRSWTFARGHVRAFLAVLVSGALLGCVLPGGLGDGGAGAGPPMPADDASRPIGPVVELGRGEAFGQGWRYSAYQSRIGACVRTDVGSSSGTACGGDLGSGGQALLLLGEGSGTGIPSQVDGFVSADVAEVWIEAVDGERFPAVLMSLAPIGEDGAAFIGFAPGDRRLARVVALDAGGTEIASERLSGP